MEWIKAIHSSGLAIPAALFALGWIGCIIGIVVHLTDPQKPTWPAIASLVPFMLYMTLVYGNEDYVEPPVNSYMTESGECKYGRYRNGGCRKYDPISPLQHKVNKYRRECIANSGMSKKDQRYSALYKSCDDEAGIKARR